MKCLAARWILLSIALALILVLSGSPVRAELKVGAGSADITPDPGKMRVTMGGYAALLGRTAEGIHDPIYAKALVFETRGVKAALVAVDLVEVSRDLREEVLNRLAGTAFGRDNLFLCATHTHAAPGAIENNIVASLVFGSYSPSVVETIAEGVAKAIKNADARLLTARLRVSRERAPGLARNRRASFYDYHTRRFSRTYDPNSESPADDTMTVLRADNRAGVPAAIIVHFSSHATTLGPGNKLLSADWPGVMRNEIERRYPGAVVMYLNGAEGDQAPDVTTAQNDYQAMELYGARVARAALPLIKAARPVKAEPLSYKIEMVDVDTMPARVGFLRIPAFLVRRWMGSMPFGALRLGDVILLGAPVEATGSLGRSIQEAVGNEGYAWSVYIGLMNQYCGYATTLGEFEKGGYEATYTLFGKAEAGLITGELAQLARELRKKP